MPIDPKTPDFLDDNIRSATVAKEMFAELGLEYCTGALVWGQPRLHQRT